MNSQKTEPKNQNHKKTCLEKNMPVFVPIFLILFIAGFFIGILWVEKIRSDRVYLQSGNIYEMPQTKTQPTEKREENIVGNDQDEHGCVGSAGYQWCEEKQKCLRVWEESCAFCGKEGDLIGEKIDECCEGLEPVPVTPPKPGQFTSGGLFKCIKKE